MMGWVSPRLRSGLIVAGIGVLSISLGGWWFTLLVGVIVHFGLMEFFQLASTKGIRPASKTTFVACQALLVLTAIAAADPTRAQWQVAAHAVLPVTGSIICGWLLLQPVTGSIADVAASIFGLFYLGFLPSHWLRLRAIDGLSISRGWRMPLEGMTPGLAVTLLALAVILAADITAYLWGSRFGRHRLIQVSPTKTVEGALGGFVAAAVVGGGGAVLLDWPLAPLSGLLLGLLVALFALVGDLTESMLKRDAGVKDSGQLIPGHGGILDRVDSYLFTPAVVYYFVLLVMPWLPA